MTTGAKRMRTAWIAVLLVAAVSSAVGTASAQQSSALRAGLAPPVLTSEGLTLSLVRAPADAGGPVRLVYASSQPNEADVRVLVDVTVAARESEARDVFARAKAMRVTRVLDAMASLGDEAVGNHGAVIWRRANVVVAVVTATDARDARVIARRVDVDVERAPRGEPRATQYTAQIPAGRVGATVRFRLVPSTARDAVVRVVGPARMRASSRGEYLLTRTGTAPLRLHVVAVDPLLRVFVRD